MRLCHQPGGAAVEVNRKRLVLQSCAGHRIHLPGLITCPIACADVDRSLGLVIILLGALAIVVGLIIWAGGLSWFGRLPGDIRIEGEHTRVYIPLVSMLVVSVILTVLFNLIGRWL